MSNYRLEALPFNCDDIEPTFLVFQVMLEQVTLRRAFEVRLLFIGDRVLRNPKRLRMPRLHFYKNKLVVLLGHNVYFAAFIAVIAM